MSTPDERVRQMYMGITDYGRQTFDGFLNGERTPERMAATFKALRDFANHEAEKIQVEVSRLPEPKRLRMTMACKPGCGYCCWQRVYVSVPEMLWIGYHVHRHYSDIEKGLLRERILQYKTNMPPANEDPGLLGRTPCPFLIEESCSIYSVRPFVCQRYNSTNLDACLVFRFNPEQDPAVPFVPPHTHMLAHLLEGVKLSMDSHRLDTERVELGRAAEIILDSPEAWTDYFSGKDVFKVAKIPRKAR